MAGNEFFEGVRCVLVDKNDTPKWTHKNISEITDSEINSYFQPMQDKTKELAI
jgi:enoyl-CoA hydratase